MPEIASQVEAITLASVRAIAHPHLVLWAKHEEAMRRCIANAVAEASLSGSRLRRPGEPYVETIAWGPDAPPSRSYVEYRFQDEPPVPALPRILELNPNFLQNLIGGRAPSDLRPIR